MLGDGGFGEDAHRYYLSSVDATGAVYAYGGPVRWPPEAGPPVIREVGEAETGENG